MFKIKYIPGKENPCDWKSRHGASIDDIKGLDRERMGIDDNEDIVVMRILLEDIPPALSIDMLKEAANRDPVYQDLLTSIKKGRKPHNNDQLNEYNKVWNELTIMDGIVLRGDRIVIPASDLGNDVGNLRQWVVELGHEAHMGTPAIKRLLRSRLWFPRMDKMVEDRTKECIACQASVATPHRDPLQPTTAPLLPFEKCSADHWGPTPEGDYVIVVIDLLTRYPEVEIVKGTGADDNIHCIDTIFARHFSPKLLLTDGGPPWNTGPSHPLQKYFKAMNIEHKTTRAADDPEANGMCEAWMRHLKKVWHTSYIENRDPVIELNKHLRQVRATPHPTTGISPAELLFNRNYRTKLPDMRANPAAGRLDIVQAREKDMQNKARMKKYKDAKKHVKQHEIVKGDQVIIERKPTKRKSPYDPDPYEVVEVVGTQIKAKRGRSILIRDSQKWKQVTPKKSVKFRIPPKETTSGWQLEIEPPKTNQDQPQLQGRRRRVREDWIVRRPALREEAPRRAAPREGAPRRLPPLPPLRGVSGELRKLAPHLTSGKNTWEDPEQFQGRKPSLRSGRNRN